MRALCLVIALCLLSGTFSISNECSTRHSQLQQVAANMNRAIEGLDEKVLSDPIKQLINAVQVFVKECPPHPLFMDVSGENLEFNECLFGVLTVYRISSLIETGDFETSERFSGQLLLAISKASKLCDSQAKNELSQGKALLSNPDNGDDGKQCLICGLLVSLATNDAAKKKVAIADHFANGFCKIFPKPISQVCSSLATELGPFLIEAETKINNSDVICRKSKKCTGQFEGCNLHSKSVYETRDSESSSLQAPKIDIWQWLMNLVDRFASDHLPVSDLDNDGFSTEERFRGYNWRGKDCNDLDPHTYPGRKSHTNANSATDFDCNGVHGVNTVTGRTFEDELCSGSDRLGVALFGDSAGSHFSIPSKYINVTLWEKGTFSDLISNAENELDFPQFSASTGFAENNPLVHSIYQRFVERNRCNRNDYQNLGVNGARVGAFDNIKAVRRNQATDHPLLVVFEFVGNDVCNGHPTLSAQTTPENFRQSVLKIWNYLDSVLPKGSHMVIWGLGKGTLLYELLHNRQHPLFVKYADFYDYLNCLETSPCWGWMNSDESIRQATQKRANELNQVYVDLIATTTFKNFDIIYYDFPIDEAMELAINDGYQPYQLIEPVDGFHPNQVANFYISEIIWKNILRDRPQWIPAINPNNKRIDELFGSSKITLEQD